MVIPWFVSLVSTNRVLLRFQLLLLVKANSRLLVGVLRQRRSDKEFRSTQAQD